MRYPLPEGNISEADRRSVRSRSRARSRPARRAFADAPVDPGLSRNVDPSKATTMQDQLAELAAFQTKVRAVRVAPRHGTDASWRKALVASEGTPPATYPIALALLLLLRDSTDTQTDWKRCSPSRRASAKSSPTNRSPGKLAFAAAQAGNIQAIAELETLIERRTDARTPWPDGRPLQAPDRGRDIRWRERLDLAKAIDAYERGMELDLNDYYCSSNLPRLYRSASAGDEERAQTVLRLVIAACERAKRRNVADEWLRATLLGAAFDAGDADKAEELADDIEAEGSARWKLESTLDDLKSAPAVDDDEHATVCSRSSPTETVVASDSGSSRLEHIEIEMRASTFCSATALPILCKSVSAAIESSFCTLAGSMSPQPSAARPSAVSSAL